MKSVAVLSLAAAAAMAAPTSQPSSTTAQAVCPQVNNTQATSNNNQAYNIYCGKWVDNDNVIRITETSIGYQGCLTACDGTVGCGAVEYIATDDAQTQGSCTIFPATALKDGASNSWTVAVPVSAPPATTTSACPTASASATSTPSTFAGLAIRSASDIHYLSVNANGQSFWLGKNTTTYCPASAGVPCPANDTTPQTVFASANSGTASLDVTVPGGQQVYVSGTGALKFTAPHSANTGEGAVVDGFSVSDLHLQFQGQDWYACPDAEVDNVWGVYAASVYAGDDVDQCLGFAFRTVDAGDAQAVWEYV